MNDFIFSHELIGNFTNERAKWANWASDDWRVRKNVRATFHGDIYFFHK